MKNILLFALIAFSINVKAQITLEHSYANASNFTPLGAQLMIIDFPVSGEQYVRINRDAGQTIDIYNLNHSLVKSISYAGFPQGNSHQAEILYLSQNLFSTDDKICFIYFIEKGSTPIYYTGIYNEDGTLLFRADSMAPWITVNVLQQQYPIYNTTMGAKMILSDQFDDTARVYSLPGTLTAGIQEANNNLIAIQTQSNVSNAYPNPNNGSAKIDYTLPDGVNEGDIVFYNVQGMKVKRFKVDRTFNTLLISTKDIAAGTYYYQLQTAGESSGGRKMVVIK